MPIYEFKCKENSHEFSICCLIAEYKREQSCPVCKSESNRVYTPFHMSVDYIDRTNYSESLGVGSISNKRELKETLKQRGLVEMPPENKVAAKERNEGLKQKKADTGLNHY